MLIAIGTGILAAVVLHKLVHRRRWRHAHAFAGGWDGAGPGGPCGGGWHHHQAHGWGGGWRHGRHHLTRRVILGRALVHLDATPAQERAIVAELERLRTRLVASRDAGAALRADLAEALRGPSLDDAALTSVLGRVDATTGEVRAALIDATRAIHALLDDGQRGKLADLLLSRRFAGGGPYRG
jgi:uncharacterized membrane protein